MGNKVVIETQYLPSLEFFCAIAGADEIQIEVHEHFVKQSYRNHTFINTANGIDKLTVPLTAKGNRIPMKDVRIDSSLSWKNNQWRTIESAYRKSPFYEHYVEDLHNVLLGNHTFLIELNWELLSICLNWLNWHKKITTSDSYQKQMNDGKDLRNVLLSKKPYTTRNFYRPMKYTQVFGNTFADNLSIVDLIFCQGPGASSILKASCLP
jgi:hypothetical protein